MATGPGLSEPLCISSPWHPLHAVFRNTTGPNASCSTQLPDTFPDQLHFTLFINH